MYRGLKITTKAIDFSAFSHWNIKEEARLERPKSLQLAADTSLELIRTCPLANPRLLTQFSLLVQVDSWEAIKKKKGAKEKPYSTYFSNFLHLFKQCIFCVS